MSLWLVFTLMYICLAVGGLVGFFVACLCQRTAAEDDYHGER